MPIFTLRNPVLEDGFVGKRVSITQDTFIEASQNYICERIFLKPSLDTRIFKYITLQVLEEQLLTWKHANNSSRLADIA